MHLSAVMRAFCEAHSDWLTVVQLPAYACELNATEGVWAHVKRGLGNLLAGTLDQAVALVSLLNCRQSVCMGAWVFSRPSPR